ncbi:hypothetical protein TWF718_004778 [Orbilia javanica]|uniref:Glutamine synthetase n=1 Tax=Orbilia javanica TaxID=47235 RepID=A0AAN8RLD9_9PEZI
MATMEEYTAESIIKTLEENGDDKVKLAGLDVDGILRGKMISLDKFKSIVTTGFGFCSVVFGWDMHDQTYFKELLISNQENGYHDIIAKVDLKTFRRIPWENNVPFFLVSFYDPDTDEPIAPCPRGLLKSALAKFEKDGMGAMAGAEYEFYQFSASPDNIRSEKPESIPSITPGMFGYSLTRPVLFQEYYYGVYDTCKAFRVPLEGWHTESGPGVYEAALAFTDVAEMADRASLFKLTVKSLGAKNGITPCFMAKPKQGLPGNSGHLHVSIVDKETGKNLFAREEKDPNPPYPDVAYLSDLGRQFLAGVLEGLPYMMPLFAPTINSYKRLVENFWAPVTVSWGLEHRAASVRLITPPTASAKATRLEVRVPGADCNPHFALAAILACGYRGIEKKLQLTIPPLGKTQPSGCERLAKSLQAATTKFMETGGIAREVLGDAFVDHFGGTREHECRQWEEAVTDWETRRYMETV